MDAIIFYFPRAVFYIILIFWVTPLNLIKENTYFFLRMIAYSFWRLSWRSEAYK